MYSNVSIRNLFFLIILVSSLANLVMGIMVLAASSQRKVNRLFGFLCLSLMTWGVSFICLNFSDSDFYSTLWTRLYTACLLFVPPLFYHLVLGSIGNLEKGSSHLISGFFGRVKQLAYVFSAGWFILTAGGVFPQNLIRDHIFLFPEISRQFWVATIFFGLLTLLAIYLLYRQFNIAKDPTQKSRLMYLIIVGIGFIVVGMAFSMFMFDFFAHRPNWVIPFGHILSSLCLILVAYALTTNQLYHFSELFRNTITFVVMSVILLVVFGGTHTIAQKLLVPYIPRGDIFVLGVASIFMALVFHPLRYWVQNLMDKIFFTERYDQMQKLRALSRQVLSSMDREELLDTLFDQLRDVGFGSICLLLKDPKKGFFHIRKQIGLDSAADGFFLKSDSLLVQYVREEKKEIIRDEVIRRILTDWERQALSDEIDILQGEICFPLFSTRRRAIFGILVIGKSDLGYSSYVGRNIFWLNSVVDNAGIMLDNFYHHDFANALVPYVGRAWADEMRRNKEGFRERLAGYRTWVAVVMVDIRHFTTISAHSNPVEVVSLLKDFRSKVAPLVYRYQGTIDKFIGDAIMIVFGLPILPELENPDKNAVECAAHIMEEMKILNRERGNNGKTEEIQIGIGVASGEVIAGNVDSGDRIEYTVIGDAANMVARLEDLAGDNTILISSATYGRVKDYVEVKEWSPRKIAGFDEPITVYELLMTKSAIDRKIAANQ